MEHVCKRCRGVISDTKFKMVKDKVVCYLCFEKKYAEKCFHCEKRISPEAESLVCGGKNYHKTCFTCKICGNLLEDQQCYQLKKPHTYCCPKCCEIEFGKICITCNKLIKKGESHFVHKNMFYHKKCFVCTNCKVFIDKECFLDTNGGLLCNTCKRNVASTCKSCGEKIMRNGIKFKDMDFHKDCLVCTACSLVLSEQDFKDQNNNFYCISCYDTLFGKKCKGCSEIISVSTKTFVSVEETDWHSNCFKCDKCKVPLLDKPFKMEENQLHCEKC